MGCSGMPVGALPPPMHFCESPCNQNFIKQRESRVRSTANQLQVKCESKHNKRCVTHIVALAIYIKKVS
jgi:hypothetical protein